VNLNKTKNIPHTTSVPNIEIAVNLPILKNLLFKDAYAKINKIRGRTKKGITVKLYNILLIL
jgi:hypothetical protein